MLTNISSHSKPWRVSLCRPFSEKSRKEIGAHPLSGSTMVSGSIKISVELPSVVLRTSQPRLSLQGWTSILRIQCLQAQYAELSGAIPNEVSAPLYPPPPFKPVYAFTKRHPKPRFGKKRVGEGKAPTYHARMLRRRRY